MKNLHKSPLFTPTLIGLTFGFFSLVYSPVLSPYMKSLGMGEELIGILFSFFPLVIILTSPVIGNVSDHVGRRKVIFAGLMFQFLATVFYLWPATTASIIIARILAGISGMCVGMIVLSMINDLVRNRQRGEETGWYLGITRVAEIMAPLIGGFLAELFFITTPFVVSLLGTGILLVSLIKWRNEKHIKLKGSFFKPFEPVKKYLSDKKLRALAFLGFTMHTRLAVFNIFLPLLVLGLGFGFKEVGIILFARSFFGMFQGWWGRISDKIGSKRIIMLSTAAASLMLISAGFAKTYPALLILMMLEGLASSFWNVSAWSFMSDIGEKRGIEGTIVGSYTSLAQIGEFLFSIIAGFIAVATGISSLFIIAGVIGIIGVIVSAPIVLKTQISAKRSIS